MGSDLVKSLKEFFFDIIGFLVPGIVVLVIVGDVIDEEFQITSETYVVLVVAYVIGYFVFALSLTKEKIFDKIDRFVGIRSLNTVSKDLERMDTFKVAKEKISNQLEGGHENLSNYKSFRNFAMSALPDSSEKIYMFMFRSEIFNQLHTISLLAFYYYLYILVQGLVCKEIGTKQTLLLVLFLIASLTLRKGWERFYRISMNIPFAMYLEKYRND